MTGNDIRLEAGDGHELDAWLVRPTGAPLGAVVVLQEVFGVNDHIRKVTARFADAGYLALAPALFERAGRGVQLDYSEVDRGRELMQSLDLDGVVADVRAAVDHLRPSGRVAAVGYCWGGAVADLAACRLDIDAAVAYYGRAIVNWLDEQPRCPVLYHFGGRDPLIPAEMVEQIRAARPQGTFHLYPAAGHGFNCEARQDWHPDSAALANERTMQFLATHLGG